MAKAFSGDEILHQFYRARRWYALWKNKRLLGFLKKSKKKTKFYEFYLRKFYYHEYVSYYSRDDFFKILNLVHQGYTKKEIQKRNQKSITFIDSIFLFYKTQVFLKKICEERNLKFEGLDMNFLEVPIEPLKNEKKQKEVLSSKPLSNMELIISSEIKLVISGDISSHKLLSIIDFLRNI